MPGVGQLVGQDVALPARVPGHGGGQVDSGAEEAREAGGRDALHRIDRQGAVRAGERLPVPPQEAGEAEIGDEEPEGHRRRTGEPQSRQGLGGGEAEGGGILRCCGRRRRHRVGGGLHRRGDGGRGRGDGVGAGIGARRGAGGRPAAGGGSDGLRRAGGRLPGLEGVGRLHPLRDGGADRLRRGEDAVLGRRKIHRHQQPQGHQAPEGILHPAGEAPAEDAPQGQQRQDQNRRGDEHFLHVRPSFARSRMAESSARSLSVSRWLSTMALMRRPTLPTFSKTLSLSSRIASSRVTAG